MTAHGELFVDEEIRDYVCTKDEKFRKLINEGGKVDASEFSGVWDTAELPEVGEAPVLNDEGIIVGDLHFKLRFVVEEGGFGRYIQPEIENAFIAWCDKKDD